MTVLKNLINVWEIQRILRSPAKYKSGTYVQRNIALKRSK